MAKVGADDVDKSTTLESNKSHSSNSEDIVRDSSPFLMTKGKQCGAFKGGAI